MSDEQVSQEAARDAGGPSPHKPKYEAPAIVDLSSPGKGAVGNGCAEGSGNLFCEPGSAAIEDCYEGSGYSGPL